MDREIYHENDMDRGVALGRTGLARGLFVFPPYLGTSSHITKTIKCSLSLLHKSIKLNVNSNFY